MTIFKAPNKQYPVIPRSLVKPFLFFFSLIFFTGLNPDRASAINPEALLNKTFAERSLLLLSWYEGYILQEDSAACFNFINAISELAEKNNDPRLGIQAELLELYYYSVRIKGHPEIFETLEKKLRSKLLAEGYELELARLEDITGFNCWYNTGNYELGFEHYLAEYELIKNLKHYDYPFIQAAFYRMGQSYYFFSDYSNTIFYMLKVIDKQPEHDYWTYYLLQANNTIGLCYQKLNQLDSADHYFRKTYEIALKDSNDAWQGIASGNLAQNFFFRKKYDEAIPLLQKDIDQSIKRKDWGCAAAAQITLADIEIKKKNAEAAASMLKRSREWINQSGQTDRLQYWYPLMSKLYGLKQQHELAGVYLDSSLMIKDSLATKYNTLQLLRAKQKTDLQLHRAEVIRIEDQQKIKILQRNALAGVLMVLLILAVYIYLLQRKRNAEKNKLLNLELKEKESQLEISSLQLNDFARSISEKSKLLEELQVLKEGTDNSALVAQLLQKTILTDEQWEHFRMLFEQVHAGYIQRLKQKIPAVTPAEIRIMVLAKLQFTTKEMADILGVSPQATRTIWYRLRKKINLPEQGSLEELVESI